MARILTNAHESSSETVFIARGGSISATYAGVLTPAALAARLAEIR